MSVELDLDRIIVSAAEMSAIETRLFDAGFPVAALMEKVAGRIAQWIQHWLSQQTPNPPHLGVLVSRSQWRRCPGGGPRIMVSGLSHLYLSPLRQGPNPSPKPILIMPRPWGFPS